MFVVSMLVLKQDIMIKINVCIVHFLTNNENASTKSGIRKLLSNRWMCLSLLFGHLIRDFKFTLHAKMDLKKSFNQNINL